jgi:hypothetical protein
MFETLQQGVVGRVETVPGLLVLLMTPEFFAGIGARLRELKVVIVVEAEGLR